MTRRADWAGAALRRWHFPDLDPPVALDHAAAGSEPPVEVPAAQDEPELRPNDVPAAPAVDAQHLAAEIAKGYDEGFQRGLADGRESGYAEGLAAGRATAEQSLAAEAQRVAAIAERLAAPIAAVERVVEDALVGLALELARCVIGSEIARSPDSLVRLIREALARAPVPLAGLRIALNPGDLELVRAMAPEIESGGAALIGDDSIEVGGCLIAVDEGEGPVKDRRWRPRNGEAGPHIDLSLAARWRSVMLALFDGEGT